MIKKIYIAISLLFVSVFAFGLVAQPAYAAFSGPFNDACQGVTDSSVCNDKAQGQSTSSNYIYGPDGILTKVVRLISILIGIVAVIVIIIAGIRFAVSGGDSAKVASARMAILYAVIGLVVAVLAQAIIIFVLNKL